MAAHLGFVESLLILLLTLGLLAGILIFFLASLERLRRRGVLQRGLVHLVFLPERRRKFLGLIGLLVICFILSGMNDSLQSIGLVNPLTYDILSSIAYGGGAIALFSLIWVALRPVEIAAGRRAELERSSQEMIMLAFAPVEVHDGLGILD
jgi:hypothetical protein